MKKCLLLIVSILIFASTSEVYSQSCCPSGLYTQITITNVLNPVSGCRFSITYCYYDAPGGDRKIFLCNITIPATQVAPCNLSNFTLNSTFWELVNQNILNDLHTQLPFVPCGEGGGSQTNLIVENTKAKCQKVYYSVILDAYVVEACDAEPGLCISEYSVCVDNGVLIKTHIAGPTYIGGGDCPTLPPDLQSSGPSCFNTCQ